MIFTASYHSKRAALLRKVAEKLEHKPEIRKKLLAYAVVHEALARLAEQRTESAT